MEKRFWLESFERQYGLDREIAIQLADHACEDLRQALHDFKSGKTSSEYAFFQLKDISCTMLLDSFFDEIEESRDLDKISKSLEDCESFVNGLSVTITDQSI